MEFEGMKFRYQRGSKVEIEFISTATNYKIFHVLGIFCLFIACLVLSLISH